MTLTAATRFLAIAWALVHLAGLVRNDPVVSGSGVLAIGALLAYAWASGAPPLVRAGLVALTARAGLDEQGPIYWFGLLQPVGFVIWPVLRAGLLAVAVLCLAGAVVESVLRVSGRPSRRTVVWTGVVAAGVLALGAVQVDFASTAVPGTVLALLMAAVAGTVAAGAALSAGRRFRAVAAGLVPVPALALIALHEVSWVVVDPLELAGAGYGGIVVSDGRFEIAIECYPSVGYSTDLNLVAQVDPGQAGSVTGWLDGLWTVEYTWQQFLPTAAGLVWAVGLLAVLAAAGRQEDTGLAS